MKKLICNLQRKVTGHISEYDKADILALRVAVYDAVHLGRTSKFRFEGVNFLIYCDNCGNLFLKHEWSGNTRATKHMLIKRQGIDLTPLPLLSFAYAMRQMIKEDCEELA